MLFSSRLAALLSIFFLLRSGLAEGARSLNVVRESSCYMTRGLVLGAEGAGLAAAAGAAAHAAWPPSTTPSFPKWNVI